MKALREEMEANTKKKGTTFTVLNNVIISEEMQIYARRTFIHTHTQTLHENTYTVAHYIKINRRKQKPEC